MRVETIKVKYYMQFLGFLPLKLLKRVQKTKNICFVFLHGHFWCIISCTTEEAAAASPLCLFVS